MPLTDLDTWADYLETVRIPLIEGDVRTAQFDLYDLDNRLVRFELDVDGELGSHSTLIDIADDKAEHAGSLADDVAQRIVRTSLADRIYTDTAIQILRNELTSGYVAGDAATREQVDISMADALSRALAEAQSDMESVRLSAIAAKNLAVQAHADAESAVNSLLADLLPGMEGDIVDLSNRLDELHDEYYLLTSDFDRTTLLEKFDDVGSEVADILDAIDAEIVARAAIGDEVAALREAAATNLAVLGPSTLRVPHKQWSYVSRPANSTPLLLSPIPEDGSRGTFLTDDPDFGDCYRFPHAYLGSIGQAYPINYEADRVYRMRVTYKVVGTGTTGHNIAFGVSVRNKQRVFDVATEIYPHSPSLGGSLLSIDDGVQTRSFYFTRDAGFLEDHGISASIRKSLPSSSDATMIYPYVRHNTHATESTVVVRSIEFTDVTEILDQITIVRNELSSEVDDISASLATNYWNAATTAGAISAMESDLRAEFGSMSSGLSVGNFSQGSGDWDVNHTVVAAGTVTPAAPGTISHLMELGNGICYDGANTYVSGFGDKTFEWTGWVLDKSAAQDARVGIRTLRADGVTYDYTAETISSGSSSGWAEFKAELTLPSDVIAWVAYVEPSTGALPSNLYLAQMFLKDTSGTAGVLATLQSDYYTSAATDAAISAANTALQSAMEGPGGSIGLLSSTLTNDYYTKTETDQTLAAERTSLISELTAPEGEIGQINAALENNYVTYAEQADALASYDLALKAELDDPTGLVGALRANLTTNYYTKVGANAATTTAVNAMRSLLEDPDGNSVGASLFDFQTAQTGINETTASEISTLKAAIDGDNTDSLAARIDNIESVKLNKLAGTAFATMLNDLEVDAAGHTSGISDFRAVQAAVDGKSSSMLGFETYSEGGNAYFRMGTYPAGLTNPDAPLVPASNIYFKADDIFLDGDVKMSKLAVTDFSGTMVPNGTFSHEGAGWSNLSDPSFEVTNVNSASRGAYALRGNPGSQNRSTHTDYFTVAGDAKFSLSFEGRTEAGSKTAKCQVAILWYDHSKNYISGSHYTVDLNSTNWTIQEKDISSPSNARYARARVYNYATNTGWFMVTGIELMRLRKGATIIEPDGITAPQISGQAIQARHLTTQQAVITESAQIKKLTVETLNIADDSIGYTDDHFNNTQQDIYPSAGWVSRNNLKIPNNLHPEDKTTKVFVVGSMTFDVDDAGEYEGAQQMRLIRIRDGITTPIRTVTYGDRTDKVVTLIIPIGMNVRNGDTLKIEGRAFHGRMQVGNSVLSLMGMMK